MNHGTITDNEVTEYMGAHLILEHTLELSACNLSDNRGASSAGPLQMPDRDSLRVSYTNIHGHEGGDWVGVLEPLASRPGNLSCVPVFVNPVARDFRLRWDSPLLDMGDTAAPLDFDLTRSDIGWSPVVPVQTLAGTISDPLEAINYEITANCTINAAIPPGATLRAASGVQLSIAVVGSGVYTLGSAQGPRTAVVGRPGRDLLSAASILFKPGTASGTELHVEGVLFNYPAIDYANATSALSFNGQFASMLLPVVLDGNLNQFQNYMNLTVPNGSTPIHCDLLFWNCEGQVSNMSFGVDPLLNPGSLSCNSSKMSIEGCEFTVPATGDFRSPLKMFNVTSSGTYHLVNNTFTGSEDQVGPLADFYHAVARLEWNRFLQCKTTAYIQTSSSLDMGGEARNEIHANLDAEAFETDTPIVALESGDLDMYCGRNSIVVADADATQPIISFTGDHSPNPDRIWRENYWGTSCTELLTEETVNDDVIGLIPVWAEVEENLLTCLEYFAPGNPACPYEPYTAFELLKLGIDAELAGDLDSAREHWYYLVILHPTAKEINEATLRLKALGQDKNYGPDHFTLVRDHLFEAADLSEGVNFHTQAVLQDCSAWCVEALLGDRTLAIAALNAMLVGETNHVCIDEIHFSLAEIATYPAQGGQSSAAPDARYTRALVQQQAVQTLLAFQRGTHAGVLEPAALPQTFAIQRLYPNPFNPTTRIELSVPETAVVRLRIFNLQGQQVATLVDGRLEAGVHSILFDGSALASGMYLARAEYQCQTQDRKMMLIK
ncbi:MAG: T9SS type A sorting domain-containing protein [Candidatus Delongbacteria bacterium]|nr:T9SS type A sorting domain-containing protein [Candidatus Delongbacteria bacterium]